MGFKHAAFVVDINHAPAAPAMHDLRTAVNVLTAATHANDCTTSYVVCSRSE